MNGVGRTGAFFCMIGMKVMGMLSFIGSGSASWGVTLHCGLS